MTENASNDVHYSCTLALILHQMLALTLHLTVVMINE